MVYKSNLRKSYMYFPIYLVSLRDGLKIKELIYVIWYHKIQRRVVVDISVCFVERVRSTPQYIH